MPFRPALLGLLMAVLSACTSSVDPSLLALSGDQAVNRLRDDKGLPPLTRDAGLARAAQKQADAMAAQERMSHAAGGAFAARVRPFYHGRYYAENIAAGQADLGGAVAAWIQSPPHRRNILDRHMHAYGTASSVGASGRRYWAMVLGG